MIPPGNDLAGADDPNVALGDLLRVARERQGLTVEDIALSTRIPKRHLEALEQNNLAALPPGPYRRGEVLAYASAVGVDPDLAIAALTRGLRVSLSSTDVRRPRRLAAPVRHTRRRHLAVVTGVLALSVLAGTWKLLRQPEGAADLAVPSPGGDGEFAPGRPASPSPEGNANAPTADVRGDRGSGGGSGQDSEIGQTTTAAGTTPPAADPVTTSAAEQHVLSVITTPAGARITVDGIGWGQSPLTIHVLPPGVRRVRATLDGYAAQELMVDVSTGAPRTVRMTLKPDR
jgi:transcriptional regulator with XRE-family HTH domain